jgi:hypothetical protein
MVVGIEVNVITGQITEVEVASGNFPITESLPTLKQQKVARAEAYRMEADPIFFMSQRGEATEQEWLDKVAEIKERFPYPTE